MTNPWLITFRLLPVSRQARDEIVETTNPWLITFRLLPVSRQARDEIVETMRLRGDARYWDERWTTVDPHGRFIRSTPGFWPWHKRIALDVSKVDVARLPVVLRRV